MNHKFKFFIFILILANPSAFALLPPYYQSSKEISTLLNDAKVTEAFGSGRNIDSITKTQAGYSIQSGSCRLDVKMNYLPMKQGMVGPANFEIQTGELNCKQSNNNDIEEDRD